MPTRVGGKSLKNFDDFGSAQFFANDDLAGRVDIVNLESAWRDQVQLSMWASDLTLIAASVRFPLSLHETCSCSREPAHPPPVILYNAERFSFVAMESERYFGEGVRSQHGSIAPLSRAASACPSAYDHIQS